MVFPLASSIFFLTATSIAALATLFPSASCLELARFDRAATSPQLPIRLRTLLGSFGRISCCTYLHHTRLLLYYSLDWFASNRALSILVSYTWQTKSADRVKGWYLSGNTRRLGIVSEFMGGSNAWLHGRLSQISSVFHPSPSPRMGLAEFIEPVEAVSVAHILGFIECPMEWSSQVVQWVCGISFCGVPIAG